MTGNSVGIDYHQRQLQICITDSSGKRVLNRVCRNDTIEVARILERHAPISSVVAEACTGSAAFLDSLKSDSGYAVKLCHPGFARRMKRNPDKSDFTDAELLSDLNRVGYLPEVWLAPEAIRDLRMFVRYRQQVVQQRKDTKLRVRAILRNHRIVLPPGTSLWSKAGVAWLTSLEFPLHASFVMRQQILELESCKGKLALCEKLLENIEATDRLVRQLMLQPGIGRITAVVIRAEVGWFSRFGTGKQLSKFCGVSPCNASSGGRQGDSGLIRAGNPILKSVIIEAAHRVIRSDSRWRAFAGRLRNNGKKGSVVAAAVANRWVRQLHHVMLRLEAGS